MRKFTLLVFALFIGYPFGSFGQEILLDLQSMPLKKVELKKSSNLFKANAASTLPFFDDFARGVSTAEPSNWIDSYVLVNQTYAINPPTIGVATFDALDEYGKIYSHLTTFSKPADYLTSQPLNLNLLTEGDGIFLSFQYQPKGLGREPLATDSLVVELLSKDDNIWIRAWSASAHFSNNTVLENNHIDKKITTRKTISIDSSFFKVMLPIKDERFLKDGFQFRFINYASLPPNTQVPSIRGNGDHWNIDLVYLEKGRTLNDTILNDISISKPIKSFLKNYEALPWKHFNEARQAELNNFLYFNMQYHNQGPITWEINRYAKITNLSDRTNSSEISNDHLNIDAFENQIFSRFYEFELKTIWEDSAKYLIEGYIETDKSILTSHLRWNDTVRYTQQFFNYYAYDDGSSEGGYGWWGEGTQNALTALKYHTYVSDSLKGILIYFNKIIDFNYGSKDFDLMVWNDNNGKPGTVVYKKAVKKPKLTYDADTLYIIDEKLKLDGDFWIGTKNSTEDMLNIGFDLNNNHRDKLYYNLSGTWMNSQLKGSLMMKPIFGKFALGQTGIDKPTVQTKFTIYPNPASSQVHLNLLEGEQPERIRIINIGGQIVLSQPYENNIDVSNLPTGIYLFQLTLNNQITTTKKLVIIK